MDRTRTPASPVKFELTDAKRVYLCGCKRSGNKPFCEGTHKKLWARLLKAGAC